MRIHLVLLDLTDTVLQEATIESALITIGSGSSMMFSYPGVGRCDITSDGYHAVLVTARTKLHLRRTNMLEVGPERRLRVDLYPRPEAVPRRKGDCPTCGGSLRDRGGGGAYRTFARSEQSCECGTVVLTLRDVHERHGQFADRSRNDLVDVTVSARCPRCLEHLQRAVYSFHDSELEVERCVRCDLVVLDTQDQQALGLT